MRAQVLLVGLLALAPVAEAFAECLPVPASCRISSRWGYRIHPTTKQYKMHNGTDFACPMYTQIRAATGGVVEAGFDIKGGNYVKVRASDGLVTKYLHNERLKVNSGATVAVAQHVADSGNTGHYTTGPHLHFVVERGGSSIDPESVLCGHAAAPQQATPDNEAADNQTASPVVSSRDSGDMPLDLVGNEGSLEQQLASIIGARALNPHYPEQLAALPLPRLYAEIAYLAGVMSQVRMERNLRLERVKAMMAVLTAARNELAFRQQTHTAMPARAQR